ncbi:MAG: hypothetical protein R3B13_24760 [Polyangiaceae bacterium]
MKETRIVSLTLELDSEQGGSSVVVREPFTRQQKVFVAGSASPAEVALALDRLGLGGQMLAAGAAAPHSLRPSSLAPGLSDSRGPGSLIPRDLGPAALLAALLDALATAVLRAGLTQESSSWDEALDELVTLVQARELDGVSRLLAVIEHALDERNAERTAMALAAVGNAIATLRVGDSALAGELSGDTAAQVQELGTLELVEVGRYRERGALLLETRLLVEPASGELFREVGCVGRGLSQGQPGRKLVVDLGQRLPSTDPPRLVIHQYEMRPRASTTDLQRALAAARRDLSLPPGPRSDPLRLVHSPLPVLLAPERLLLEKGEALTLVDDAGNRLAVLASGTAAPTEALVDLVERGEQPLALVGSLVTDASGIGLLPWTAWLQTDDGPRPFQLSV